MVYTFNYEEQMFYRTKWAEQPIDSQLRGNQLAFTQMNQKATMSIFNPSIFVMASLYWITKTSHQCLKLNWLIERMIDSHLLKTLD